LARAKRQPNNNTPHSLETGEGSHPSGRGEGGIDATSPSERKRKALPPSLDYSVKTCGKERVTGGNSTLVGWVVRALDPDVARRKRGRAFHRFLSGIKRCRHLGRDVYFLTLTSSRERRAEYLKRDSVVLVKRCREFFGPFEYCMIKTDEGNGVIHMLFHCEGCQNIPLDALHSWFSVNWAEIHKAPIVWICKAYGDKRLAGYLTQYLASQKGETRMSWSWGWVHRGFVHDWEELKRSSEDIKRAIEVWDWYLANDLVWRKYRLAKARWAKL